MCILHHFKYDKHADSVFTHCRCRGRTQSVFVRTVWRRPRQAGTPDSTRQCLCFGQKDSPPYWPKPRPANHQRDQSKWDEPGSTPPPHPPSTMPQNVIHEHTRKIHEKKKDMFVTLKYLIHVMSCFKNVSVSGSLNHFMIYRDECSHKEVRVVHVTPSLPHHFLFLFIYVFISSKQ